MINIYTYCLTSGDKLFFISTDASKDSVDLALQLTYDNGVTEPSTVIMEVINRLRGFRSIAGDITDTIPVIMM